METRLKVLLQAAYQAGAVAKKHLGIVGLGQAKFKGGITANLVSRVDHLSQETIIKRIHRFFPQDRILAEEGDLSHLKDTLRRGPLWVIDPLDGTINFLHGFPSFGVSIAYCEDSKPVLGAVYDPCRQELFWAKAGSGAYFQGKRGARRPLRVSPTAKLDDALMGTGFGYDRRKNPDFYLRYCKAFMQICHDLRRVGAAALDLAWVAAGRLDGFWEWNLSPWDVAAGALLVSEAGGRVSHFNGSSYSIFQCKETLATNARIHPQCLRVLRGVQDAT